VTAAGIACWGMLGVLVGAVLRISVERSAILPREVKRLAPPALLEVITALLFTAFAWRVGSEPDLFAYSWLAAVGVPLAAVDCKIRRLPTKMILPGGVIFAGLLGVAAIVHRDVYPLVRAGAGMLVLLAGYGMLYFLRPGQLGGGDLRLAAVLGLALGWAGWLAILDGTLFGWVSAAIALALRHITRRAEHRSDVPLGPFLLIGASIALLMS
jgi:leader peptidase (prepilin peptidase)/N-methyltransferase